MREQESEMKGVENGEDFAALGRNPLIFSVIAIPRLCQAFIKVVATLELFKSELFLKGYDNFLERSILSCFSTLSRFTVLAAMVIMSKPICS